MRAFVFTNLTLKRHAGQFVWLSIDTEKAANAAVLAKYPVQVWPSFYVIDAATETIALRWVGGATVDQLEKIFDDGSRAVTGVRRGIDQQLAAADRLFGEGKHEEAARRYSDILRAAPPGWKSYRRTLESLLFAFQESHQLEPCARTARDAFALVKSTSSSANVVATGLDCAVGLPENAPPRAELVTALAADARAVIADPPKDVAADDLSSLYQTMASERAAAKDEAGRKKILSDWAVYLERQAALGSTPEARAVFDSHRLTAYLELGQPERAIPMLEASERDLPADYNPAARMAVAYRALKRYDDALAASDRALPKAYGPRKLGILQTRADIFTGRGDAAAARQTLEEAVRTAESLPPAQRSEKTIAVLKKKLESLP